MLLIETPLADRQLTPDGKKPRGQDGFGTDKRPQKGHKVAEHFEKASDTIRKGM